MGSDPRQDIRRQLLVAAGLMLAIVLVGSAGYHQLGEGAWSFAESLYMTIITLSTVGFGETLPGMAGHHGARVWTLLLILLGSGTLLFFVSTFTAFVIEGDIQGTLRRRRMQKRIDELESHIILVGVGATGIHVAEELLATHTPFVAIDVDEQRLVRVYEEHGQGFLYVCGDATQDSVLEQAGIGRAKGLAATLRDDKDNVFVSITARALNAGLTIAAKMTEDSAESKLRRAGADLIVSPSYIGGMRLASELVRPSVVQFLDRMRSQDLRVEEVDIPDGSPLVGRPLRETSVRHQTKALVMAVRETDGSYSYNPGPDFTLLAGHTLVVLCKTSDIGPLRKGIQSGTS